VSYVAVRRTVARGCVAAIAASALLGGTAIADDDVPVAGCPVVPTIQPFAPWGDLADYFLVPDGDVENGASSWDLGGGAAVADRNSPFGAGTHSLSLPDGATATTAPVCVGVEHRTMRFFAQRPSSGSLTVEAIYAKKGDTEKSVRIATISGASEWSPSPIVPMVVNEIAPKYANALPVSLRFTAHGSGTWSVDDVYVDPYRRG